MTILNTISSIIDVIVGPELMFDYITNLSIYYRRQCMSSDNCMTILLTLASTIDITLDPELIT